MKRADIDRYRSTNRIQTGKYDMVEREREIRQAEMERRAEKDRAAVDLAELFRKHGLLLGVELSGGMTD